MAIAFDAAAFIAAVPGGSFTVGAGSNRILFVHVSYQMATGGTVHSSGVTYNGVAMTQVPVYGSTVTDDGTTKILDEVWYLVAPASGAHTVAVTTVGTPTKSGVGAISFSGADQSPTFSVGANSSGSTGSTPVHTGAFSDSSGAWGVCFGTLKYGGIADPAPNTPTVLTNSAYVGTLA